MAKTAIFALCIFFSAKVLSISETWESSYKNGSFSCRFKNTPKNVGYSACYLPGDYDPITMRSKGNAALVRRGFVNHASRFEDDGSATVILSDGKHHNCIMCTSGAAVIKQTCLACRGASSMHPAPTSDPLRDLRDRWPVFIQSGVEKAGDVRYFYCRFRINPSTSTLESAWLNEGCKFSASTRDPVEACKGTPSFLSPLRRGKYVTIRARVKHDSTQCRVCMLRADGLVTVNRACMNVREHDLIKDLQIGRSIIAAVLAFVVMVVIVCIIRMVLSTDLPKNLFTKMFRVRTVYTRFSVLYMLLCLNVILAVKRPVTPTRSVRAHTMVLQGLRLCIGSRYMNVSEIETILNR